MNIIIILNGPIAFHVDSFVFLCLLFVRQVSSSNLQSNVSKSNQIKSLSAATQFLCSSEVVDSRHAISKLAKDRVNKAVAAITKIMYLPADACSDADFYVSYLGKDAELLTPIASFSNPVYCEAGWVVILRRQDGSVNFTRPWTDYEDGFGDRNGGEFWLGNHHLHRLTSEKTHKLHVEMTDFNGDVKTAEYSHFVVGPAEDNYRLQAWGYVAATSSAGDGLLSRHSGNQFSTYDRDNDVYGSNCALSYKGGWWYSSCHNVNPTGLYLTPPKSSSSTLGINWVPAYNDRRSFKTFTMKIRPV